jgi:alkyl hydroperoxide reductase subunit AhpF
MVGHNIALANENIRTTMIEANYFGDLSRKYNVSSVPQVVINENIIFVGALPEEEYVKKVMEAL